ncbi:hypothetical protein L3i20_v233240 [Paenibacillus sp. L3-i20]|nr:hypothetical protein L3i20_v233240 [Paenibacillus sp. L3-i20]
MNDNHIDKDVLLRHTNKGNFIYKRPIEIFQSGQVEVMISKETLKKPPHVY